LDKFPDSGGKDELALARNYSAKAQPKQRKIF